MSTDRRADRPAAGERARANVHVNGHGETTFHPKWVAWCRRIVEAGHLPCIITNLAKHYTDAELEMLAEFRAIQVSLDSDDGEMMKRINSASVRARCSAGSVRTWN